MRNVTILLLLFLILSFTMNDEPGCSEVRLFEKAPFAIGVAINTTKLKEQEVYRRTAQAQFNSFTAEKVMKPQYIHPKRNVFHFEEVDHLIEYCSHYNIRLHGHTLVWHKALPAWLEHLKAEPQEWEALLKEHIQSIVNHCKGYIKSWDVVNEAFNEDGTIRNNIWMKHIGESYIEKAFLFAHEADPSALLFYNDYSLERNGEKLNSVLSLLAHLRSRGVPVHGIGMQMHISLEYPEIAQINQSALRIQEAGYLVHYSELDISLSADQKLFASGKKLLALQKDRMKEVVEGYRKLKPDKRFGITLWAVGDGDSWLTEDHFRARPVLFNARYKIKPAYCGFLEGLTD
jgi:endo-1,4-beta-xylanase